MTETDATELVAIVSSETPESEVEPFGERAKKWLKEKSIQGASGVGELSVDIAKDLIKQYIKQFYFGG